VWVPKKPELEADKSVEKLKSYCKNARSIKEQEFYGFSFLKGQ
jgi:hypothetical protein